MMFYRTAGLGETENKLVEYTSSQKQDKEIKQETILVMIAHIIHLTETNLIPSEKSKKILKALLKAYENPPEKLEETGYEDIHEALEAYLYQEAGEDAFYAPLARSRNDHIATILRMKTKKELINLIETLLELRATLLKKASEHTMTPWPGQTHYQPAQTITYAHYLLALEEELAENTEHLLKTYEQIDKSPMGSGALAGTSVLINRNELAKLLGFPKTTTNTLYSTSSRYFINLVTTSLIPLLTSITRITEDLINHAHPATNILPPPITHAQTSSLMPQKKNPATLEIARARASMLVAEALKPSLIESKLPIGYNLDLQEITPTLWNMMSITREMLKIVEDYIEKAEPNKEKIETILRQYPINATELAETLALENKIPYRKAHQIIAETLAKTNWNIEKTIQTLKSKYKLTNEHILDQTRTFYLKKTKGSPNPDNTQEELKEKQQALKKHSDDIKTLEKKLTETYSRLIKKAYELSKKPQ